MATNASGKSAKSNKTENDWLNAQQQFWDTWFTAAREGADKQMEQMLGQRDQWGEFFNVWQTVMGGQGSQAPDVKAWQDMFASAARGYMGMLDAFSPQAAGAGGYDSAIDGWIRQMRGFLNSVHATGAHPTDFATAGRIWASNAAKMHELFGMTNPFAAHFAHAHKGFQSAASGLDPFGFFAAMPAIGYTREKQEDLQTLMNLWSDYERKLGQYNAAMAEIGLKALEEFQSFLADPPKGTEPLTSIKDVFAKWVDISEAVYGDFAMTDVYTQLYGDVVNAMMSYRKQFSKMLSDVADSFDLPTRPEIDSLHCRVHDLRRENRQLRAELDEIRAQLGLTAAGRKKAAPAAKKAPVKKKATKKAAVKKTASRKAAVSKKTAGKAKPKTTKTRKGRK